MLTIFIIYTYRRLVISEPLSWVHLSISFLALLTVVFIFYTVFVSNRSLRERDTFDNKKWIFLYLYLHFTLCYSYTSHINCLKSIFSLAICVTKNIFLTNFFPKCFLIIFSDNFFWQFLSECSFLTIFFWNFCVTFFFFFWKFVFFYQNFLIVPGRIE